MASGEIQAFVPIISKAYTTRSSGEEITFLSPVNALYLIYALVTNSSYGSFWMVYLNSNSLGYNQVSNIWSNSSNAAITINITAPGKITITTIAPYVNILIISFDTYIEQT